MEVVKISSFIIFLSQADPNKPKRIAIKGPPIIIESISIIKNIVLLTVTISLIYSLFVRTYSNRIKNIYILNEYKYIIAWRRKKLTYKYLFINNIFFLVLVK